MVKAIIFDLWGTIVDAGVYPSPVKQAKRVLRIRGSFPEYIVPFEKVFMTQPFDSLKDGFEAVARSFKIPYNNSQLEELVGLWNKQKLLASLYPDSLDVLKKLKKKYKLGLICNTDAFTVEPVLEKLKLDKLFDAMVLSYKEGFLKTDQALFQTILNKLDAKPEEAVMVGDSVASDMKGAELAGVKGILIDRRDRRLNFPVVIKDLNELENVLAHEN